MQVLERLLDGQGWPPEDPLVLAEALLENFASPDPHLRDELSYTLLDRLIDGGLLSTPELAAWVERSIDEHHLSLGLGESGTDSVFRRSFSVLVVPLVVEYDAQRGGLAPSTIAAVIDAVLTYARSEQDWRGYVVGKGWAHATAHTADAIGSLGRHPHTPAEQLPELLAVIHHLATVPHALGYLEDDRLAYAAWRIIRSGRLLDQHIHRWLDGFQLLEGPDTQAETLRGANAEHFLRSLYFRCKAHAETRGWLDAIQMALDRFDIFILYPPPDLA